jgi:hypothetical protein
MRNNELAMHLWAGYTDGQDSSITNVCVVAIFVPYLEAASQTLDAQLLAGRDNWDKVFAYDVAHEAGAWLKANRHSAITTEDFAAKLQELIA